MGWRKNPMEWYGGEEMPYGVVWGKEMPYGVKEKPYGVVGG